MINRLPKLIFLFLVIWGIVIVLGYSPLSENDRLRRAIYYNKSPKELENVLNEIKQSSTLDRLLLINSEGIPILVDLIKSYRRPMISGWLHNFESVHGPDLLAEDAVRHLEEHNREALESAESEIQSYRSLRKIISLLIAHRIGIDSIDQSSGMSPIHWALVNGNESILKELVNSDTNLNQRDSDGRTALFYSEAFAVMRASSIFEKDSINAEMGRIASYLVSKGANINVKDLNGNCIAVEEATSFSPRVLNEEKFVIFEELGLHRKNCINNGVLGSFKN